MKYISVLNNVCEQLSISISEVVSRKRNAKLVEARDIYIYISKFKSNDFEDIARTINRDRCTVYASWSRTVDRMKFDKEYRNKVLTIKEYCNDKN